jgi:RHS repeat-associated protein
LSGATETGAWTQTYDCDRYGNRAVRSNSYIPSPLLTPQSATSTDFSAFNQSTNQIALTGFGYDSSGNLTGDPTTGANEIVYDSENHQTSYTKSAATTSYSYDGDGRRVRKTDTTGTTVFVYNPGGQVIAEYGGPSTNGGISYLTTDHLGSTRVVANSQGNVIARHDYLPFGEEIGNVGGRTTGMGYGAADDTRQKFTSKERDNESMLDYFGARYYSGAQGRFTSIDPMSLSLSKAIDPQQFNRYGYVRNNPLKHIDPDGADLKFAAGLSKADQDRLLKDAVKLYRKESGREALNQLAKSDVHYVLGTGQLASTPVKGGTVEQFGLTEPKEGTFKGSTDPITHKVDYIQREGLVINITLDVNKLDQDRSLADQGKMTQPPSEQRVFNHEIAHALDKDTDLVNERNETDSEAEAEANGFAQTAGSQKDTLSERDAERQVREIFGLPPKDQKKDKKDDD